MNEELARLFNTGGLAEQEKLAAANLINGIREGSVNLDGLSDEDLLKVAQVIDQYAPELQQENRRHTQEEQEKQAAVEWFQAQDMAGRIQAHAQWDEMKKIAANEQYQTLSKIASVKIEKAVKEGSLDLSGMNEAQFNQFFGQVIEKLAAMPGMAEAIRSGAGMPGMSDAPMGMGEPPTEAVPGLGGAMKEDEAVARAINAETPLWQRLKSGLGGAATSVDEFVRSMAGKTGIENPTAQRALGYGLPAAMLAGGGLGLHALLKDRGGEGEQKAASAGFNPLNALEKQAAANIHTAVHSGQLDLTKLSEADLQQIDLLFTRDLIEKVAANPEDYSPEVLEQIKSLIGGVTGEGKGLTPGAQSVVSEAVGAPGAGGALGGWGRMQETLGAPSPTAGAAPGLLGKLTGYLGQQGGRLGSAITGGRLDPRGLGARALGIGGPAALAAGGGLGLHALLSGGNEAEKGASAQNDFNTEVYKTAQAMLTLNGINPGMQYDPQQVKQAAADLLRQNGWQVD